MLPANGASVSILSKRHRPCNNTGVAKHVIVIAKSTVIGDEKTATNTKQFLNQFQASTEVLSVE